MFTIFESKVLGVTSVDREVAPELEVTVLEGIELIEVVVVLQSGDSTAE